MLNRRAIVIIATSIGVLLGLGISVFVGIIPAVADALREVGSGAAMVLGVLAAQQAFLTVVMGAMLAATLAVLGNTLLEYIKRRIAKAPLLELFIADLDAMWKDVHQNGHYHESGTTFVVRNIQDLKLTSDVPVRAFETYNVKLYETEGLKLAPILGTATRRHFWKTYRTMREVESARLALKDMGNDDRNRESMIALFAGLNTKLDDQILELTERLKGERSIFQQYILPFVE